MKNNILIGLSGGPSVAINASLSGIIKEASKDENVIIYGAINGIEGVLNDNIKDLREYADEESLALLRQTPAMALGSCRHKLKEENFNKVISIFEKYDIGTFFYIGGNDSMDTVLKLNKYVKENNIDVKVIGVPKTIDNDLPETDHTPGFGSSAKYLYHTMSEIICDTKIYPVKNVVIVEIMGRNSGWLTLAAALPRFLGGNAPHIIALPETPFDEDEFIARINEILKEENFVICAVSEGIKDKDDEYIGQNAKSGMKDTFGHIYLSGVGKYLERLVAEKIGCKVRSIELNVMQRCASHLASKTDIDEAVMIGKEAYKASLKGLSGDMMVFIRESDDPYKVSISSVGVEKVANLAKDVPNEWLDVYDKDVQKKIVSYLLPLIKGDLDYIKDETGLLKYLKMY